MRARADREVTMMLCHCNDVHTFTCYVRNISDGCNVSYPDTLNTDKIPEN